MTDTVVADLLVSQWCIGLLDAPPVLQDTNLMYRSVECARLIVIVELSLPQQTSFRIVLSRQGDLYKALTNEALGYHVCAS